MEESKKNLVEKVNTSFHCMSTSLKNYFQQRVPFGPCLTNFCKTEEHLYKFILQNRKAYTTKFEELAIFNATWNFSCGPYHPSQNFTEE